MGGTRDHNDPEADRSDPAQSDRARNDQSRALHPSAGNPSPEQFRRCGRHWFDPAIAGCDDCGRALCPDCVIAVEDATTLCDGCTVGRASLRSRSRSLERRRWQGGQSSGLDETA